MKVLSKNNESGGASKSEGPLKQFKIIWATRGTWYVSHSCTFCLIKSRAKCDFFAADPKCVAIFVWFRRSFVPHVGDKVNFVGKVSGRLAPLHLSVTVSELDFDRNLGGARKFVAKEPVIQSASLANRSV
jgi:hypothetical protein